MSDLNRREFVAAAAVAAGACVLGISAAMGQEHHGHKPPATDPGPADAGALTGYKNEGVVSTFAWEKHFYLVTTGGVLTAISSVCTHKGCMVEPKDPGFKCPCHGAEYNLDGTITKETKTKIPLDHYSISVDDKGKVTVDTSKVLAATDAGASVKVDAK